MRVVSVPAVGSVTPKACRRSSPVAILRQIRRLLLGRAVPQQRAHGVHLRVGAAAVAARAMDLLQDGRRRAKAEARAAVFLGDQHRQVAFPGQGLHELGRIGSLAVQAPPVFAGEAGAELPHRLADFGKGQAHERRGGLRRPGKASTTVKTTLLVKPRSSRPPAPARAPALRVSRPGAIVGGGPVDIAP